MVEDAIRKALHELAEADKRRNEMLTYCEYCGQARHTIGHRRDCVLALAVDALARGQKPKDR